MLRRLDELAESGRSLAFESTLPSCTFPAFLEKSQGTGLSYQSLLCMAK